MRHPRCSAPDKIGFHERCLPRAGVDRFFASARSVLLITRDPDDETRRIVFHTKSNLAAQAPSLGFCVTNGVFRWTGVVDTPVADALSEPKPGRIRASDVATALIGHVLKDGHLSLHEIEGAAEECGGISTATLRRALAKKRPPSFVTSQAIEARKGGNGNYGTTTATEPVRIVLQAQLVELRK
jgi:hypothetical protein